MDSDPRLVVFFIILSTNPKMLQMMNILVSICRFMVASSGVGVCGPLRPSYLRKDERPRRISWLWFRGADRRHCWERSAHRVGGTRQEAVHRCACPAPASLPVRWAARRASKLFAGGSRGSRSTSGRRSRRRRRRTPPRACRPGCRRHSTYPKAPTTRGSSR